jgi:hypothetical protein
MQIPVLVDPIENGRFRASAGDPFGFSAEGTSPEEAVRAIERQIAARLASGSTIIGLTLRSKGPQMPAPSASSAAAEVALDEWFDRAFQEGIDEYRRKDDEELRRQEEMADS